MKIHIADFLFALSTALDCVEKEIIGVSTNHSKRVALMSARICRHMGFTPDEVHDMACCAILHDNALTEYTLRVGRHRAARLNNVELHCASGEANSRDFPFCGDTTHVILHHHENWDGSGFFGKKGAETNVRAAALRLADHVDSILHLGDGDPALLLLKGRTLVSKQSKRLYNPQVAAAFLEIFDETMLHDLSNAQINGVLARFAENSLREVSLRELLTACKLFSGITDAKSPHTAKHCRGVAEKTAFFATSLGLDEDHVCKLTIAAHLHDVGKLVIPPEILEKPGVLTPEEFRVMRSHAYMTEEILRGVRGLEEIVSWAASHHEKLNGSGYPHGWNDERLPLESRILACVDVYQALVEDRPYRAGMSHCQATNIMHKMSLGGALDGDLVKKLYKTFA